MLLFVFAISYWPLAISFIVFCLQIPRKKRGFSLHFLQNPILRIQIYKSKTNKTKKRPVSLLTEHKSFETERTIFSCPYKPSMPPDEPSWRGTEYSPP